MASALPNRNAVMGMWIHEHSSWPNFTWNIDRLSYSLASIRHDQGRLLGKMEGLGFELRSEASLTVLTEDVLKSSVIEGEMLPSNEVRSSIARKLGLERAGLVPTDRRVDGVVEMMLDATQRYGLPLTKERLLGWHSALFPTGRSGMRPIGVGTWRTIEAGAMQVVSGPIGKEKIHFEAPGAERIEKEMSVFLNWFNEEPAIDSVLKAGIAHLWFVTLHPFEDGNGRMARAIGDMGLARAEGMSQRFYSLSSQIEAERNDYYHQLEKQQSSTTDITGWLVWFLGCLGRSISGAEHKLSKVLFKAQLTSRTNKKPINERQLLIINRMLEDSFEGFMNTAKYAKLAKCSNDTALRDIQDLKERGILIQNPGAGRSTSYKLTDYVTLQKS